MEKVLTASYLVVGNVERYRQIMRFFYKRHRQMQGILYRPEILQMMQEEFSSNYGQLELDQDLEQLVIWGNLQKQQEMLRPKSIEEYRNKNFRYQITENGILIEEMVYQLIHQKHTARGALDEKGIRTLLRLLEKLINEPEDIVELWQKIREEFRKVGEDTANYIGYITSPEVDSRMKTEQFLVYKDKFVSYLRDFISTLQNLYHQFIVVVKQFDTIEQGKLIAGIYQKEQEVPMMDQITYEEVQEQVLGEIKALKNWFIGTADRPSEYENLMQQTDQMITKITGLIYYFGQEIHQYQSRKKDYLHLARWFYQAETLEDAQKMYAGIFGLEHSRHYYVNEGSNTTSNRADSWALLPGKLLFHGRGRGVGQERRAKSFTLNKVEQQKQLAEFKKQQIQFRQKIDSYFQEDYLDFSTIQSLDKQTRTVFLKWISLAISSYMPTAIQKQTVITQKITTELDFAVMVTVDLTQDITVSCEDGQLEMPKVEMRRVI